MAARVGNLFRTSGVSGRDPKTNELPSEGAEQVALVFANAATLLEVAGVGRDEVVFVEVLLETSDLRQHVDRLWLQWYPDHDDRPARHTTVRELPGRLQAQLRIEAWTESHR
jgi:2-iminobutanoate/2-iminopropanoate deaminase